MVFAILGVIPGSNFNFYLSVAVLRDKVFYFSVISFIPGWYF